MPIQRATPSVWSTATTLRESPPSGARILRQAPRHRTSLVLPQSWELDFAAGARTSDVACPAPELGARFCGRRQDIGRRLSCPRIRSSILRQATRRPSSRSVPQVERGSTARHCSSHRQCNR
jgi:hypothetical protein